MESWETRRAAGPQSLGLLPLVNARGRHADVGFQVGADRADQVNRMVESYRRLFTDAGPVLGVSGWNDAVRIAHRYLPFIQSTLPQYADEMRGMAEGAQVSFDEILVLNCLEAITSDRLELGCTSMAVSGRASADGSVLVAHNEDWYPADLQHVYLVRAEVEGEPPFLAVSYGGLLPNIGLNAAGIAQCCDTVYPTDVRLGVPRILVSRAVLAAETLDQAIEAALHPERAAGYNHLLATADGDIINLEASATDFDTLSVPTGVAVHTNHYQSRHMQEIEQTTDRLSRSRARLARAEKQLGSQNGSLDETSLISVLVDHDGGPYSICCHAQDMPSVIDQQQTIASLVMNLSAGTLRAAWGNPCEATFAEYSLTTEEPSDDGLGVG